MSEMVTFRANGQDAQGYIARPSDSKGPGLVVLQEWWGLVPHIKGICDGLAREGFVAIAPDLYHGETTTSPDQAGKLMMALRIDQAEKEMRGAVDWLESDTHVTSGKVGVIGFCMGGALALFAASRNPKVGACAVFYGIHPNAKPDLQALQAPVLGIWAENDSYVTPDAVKALDADLTRLGKRHDFHTYPGVGHAFMNETGKNYEPAAAADAWRRAVGFLKAELR
jgi:carboxymethylenebutenolidase